MSIQIPQTSRVDNVNSSQTQPPGSVEAIDCSQIEDWSREVGWDIDYQQVGKGAFHARFFAASCADLKITSQLCNREMMMCGSPPRDMLAVVLPTGSAHLGTYEGRTLGRNDAIILYPGDGRMLCSPPGFRASTVSIPLARFEVAARHHAGRELPALLSGSRSVSLLPERLRRLTGSLCSLVGGQPKASGEAATVELEDRILQQLLSSLFEATGGRQRPPRRGNRADYVRRARDFIEDQLDQVIPLSRVAAYAGVSTRTLELAFRDILGTTMTEYIRSRRLNRARRHLLENSCETSTLAGLALDNGLTHFGRFARDYKALFGELPSKTRIMLQARSR